MSQQMPNRDRLAAFDPSALQWFFSAQSMPLAITVDTPVTGFLTNGTNVVVSGTVGPAVDGVLVRRTSQPSLAGLHMPLARPTTRRLAPKSSLTSIVCAVDRPPFAR